MRAISLAIVLGIVGLAAGYFIFAQFNGTYLSIKDLIFPPKNILDNVGQAITGAAKIRQNILICGGAGAVVGLILGALSGSRR